MAKDTTQTDVVTLILADHREVERIFETLREDQEARPQAVLQLRALMLAHSEAEEAIVYPTLKPEMEDEPSEEVEGDKIDEAYDEHAEAEQLLDELADTDPESEDFDSVLADVMESINHHVEDEESDLLPRLRDMLQGDEMQRIMSEFHRVRMEILEQEGGQALGFAPEVYDPLSIDLRDKQEQRS